jgi:hypothetical protein
MKLRFLLALAAAVLTTAACADSITGPTARTVGAVTQTSDTTTIDGPGWGSGT